MNILPGRYFKTRDGTIVLIEIISGKRKHDAFPIRGRSVEDLSKNIHYSTWTREGKFQSNGENPKDLVEEIGELEDYDPAA